MIRRASVIPDAGRGDLADQAALATEQFVTSAIAKVRMDLSVQENAEGTVRTCSECEEPIPLKRLEAVPGTRLCVRCKQLSEMN